jgi:hypothetical protein
VRLTAEGNARVVIAFAEVPQTDLVEVVKADRAGDGIDEDGIGHGARDDTREINFKEVGSTQYRASIEVADADED